MNNAIRTICVFSVTLLAACGAEHTSAVVAQMPAPELLATTRQVMLGITIPTSDVVFQVGAQAPQNDADWEKVEANALALAESGALLTMGSRAVDQKEWLQHCRDLIAAAKSAAGAAREKDVDKVLDAGNTIYEVCDGCHKKYMPARQGEDAAEAATAGE